MMRNRFDEQLNVLNSEMIRMGALCEEVIALAAKALDAKMGEDIRLIGITDISTLADYFLICTART